MLAAPEITVGAVIVLGVVVVAAAIKEELDAYEFRHAYPEEAGTSRETKVASREAGKRLSQEWVRSTTHRGEGRRHCARTGLKAYPSRRTASDDGSGSAGVVGLELIQAWSAPA
ncbi:hypothetical protein [Corallococcus exercitus]|uniref:hypothetical protein n=1 Tax=Corallococcus exercitus TaxID=2316736 RepID=UPI0035D40996